MSVLPSAVTHNGWLKVAALVGAVFLWAIAPTDRTQRESLTSVPIRVQVADLNWALAGSPFPSEVEVRFTGPARELIRLAREGTAVRIQIAEVIDADTTVTLRRDWVLLDGASELVVEEILPGSVQLEFEPVVAAALAVELRTIDSLPDGLAFASPLGVTPAVVRARGPARLLEQIDSVPTLPIDLSEISSSGIRTVSIDTTGLGGTLLTPLEVSVGIRVDEEVERLISSVPVRLIGPGADEYQVDVDSMDVTLRAAEVRFQSASLDSIGLVVDTRDIGLLEVGESREVVVTVIGVPPLVEATPEQRSVTVSRPGVAAPSGGGEG